MNEHLVHVRRALISVADKQGLEMLAPALHELGIELVSTGGTATAIRDCGVPVRDVTDVTRYPEMMDGRVKTLHPAIHGGLLADMSNPQHVAALEQQQIPPIDLVVANFYPFAAARDRDATVPELIESIDIGGPAMVRAAAKNHARLLIVTSPDDYAEVVATLHRHAGHTPLAFRQKCAAQAFALTADYDAMIADWAASKWDPEPYPQRLSLSGHRHAELRYGENPHQRAASYRDHSARPGVLSADLRQGKPLSFNNLQDADLAYEAVGELATLSGAGCVIVKHASPCGAAVADSPVMAFRRARATDSTSAFGGVVGFNCAIDADTLRAMAEGFLEVVIAPELTAAAQALIGTDAVGKNLRVLVAGGIPNPRESGRRVRVVAGGFLLQDCDTAQLDADELKVVTQRAPTVAEEAAMQFAWRVVKYVRSNAIVFARDHATMGIGGGQTSRVDAVQGAVDRMRRAETTDELVGREEGASLVMASDAFFPFPDGIEVAADAGVTAVIQPGGSVRDQDVIAAAERLGMAMVFTGLRHFLH